MADATLVTLAQAATLLGVPRRRLYRWRSEGKIPLDWLVLVEPDGTRLYDLEKIRHVRDTTRRGRPRKAR